MQQTMAEIDYKYSVFECQERMRWNGKVRDELMYLSLILIISNFLPILL